MNNVEDVIAQLENQRSAIDRAISALREATGSVATGSDGYRATPVKAVKRHLSPEGRRRIIEATKARWAAQRAAAAGPSQRSGTAPALRKPMSPAARKRLALAMKKRWAAAKRAGRKQLA